MTKPYIKQLSYVTFYYKDKACSILHREDGPAIEYADGGKFWWLNGERHREDGPACDYPNGSKIWYLNGEEYSEQEHEVLTKRKNLINFL